MPPNPETIAAQIAAIQDRIENWHSDEQAIAQVASLWGGSANNQNLFAPAPLEIVAEYKRTQAGVHIAESPNGLFAYGLHFSSPESGFGFFPSIWREAYSSREEAMQAALTDLLERTSEPRPGGKAAAQQIQQVRRQIEARLKPQQRLLF